MGKKIVAVKTTIVEAKKTFPKILAYNIVHKYRNY